MFKRLRERITEEATKFPGGQLGNNVNRQPLDQESKTEDLITLSESPAVVVPHTSSQQFSIGEDEDGSLSEQSTPIRKLQDDMPTRNFYTAPSDIESGREDPPTLNLGAISQEEFLSIVDVLKARVYKYKNKYRELAGGYNELKEAKVKLEHALTEHQDKSLRRITELREQCQLEQKAKADLDANLRLMLEEKDSRISVLETQNNFLKEGRKPEISNHNEGASEIVNDSILEDSKDVSTLREKMERLDHQLNQAKKTIKGQTEQINLLRQQNESISTELETKVQVLANLEKEYKELALRMEESAMSMAETKKNMHEEMQFKEKQLNEATDELERLKVTYESEKSKVNEIQKGSKEQVEKLERQLEATEKILEEEKQNLMQELNRGKSAALTLLQQDCANKIASVEDKWKSKYEDLISQKDSTSEVLELKEKLKLSENHVKDLNMLVLSLEKDNSSLKLSFEEQQKEDLKSQCNNNLQQLEEKLVTTQKSYYSQAEELKNQISQLQTEVETITVEKESLQKSLEQLEKTFQQLGTSEKGKTAEVEILKLKIVELQSVYDKILEENKEMEKWKSKSNSLEKQLQESCSSLQTSEAAANEKITQLKSAIEETLKKKEGIEVEYSKKLKSLEEENSTLSGRTNHVKAEKEELNEKLKKVEQQVSIVKQLESEKNALKQQKEAFEEELNCLKSVQELSTSLKKEVKKLLAEKLSLEKECSAALAENKLLKQSEEHSKANVKKLLEDNTALSNENRTIVSEMEELKSSSQRHISLEERVSELESENQSLQQKTTKLNSSAKAELPDDENASDKMAIKILEERHSSLRVQMEKTMLQKEKQEEEMTRLRETLENEKKALQAKNESLIRQVTLLQDFDPHDKESKALKEYVAVVKKDCEAEIRMKNEDIEVKLKHLVKDFCEQMDLKDRDCDKMVSDLLEKNHDIEDRLLREHEVEVNALKQDLFERECALEEMRDNYEESLQVKDKKLKEYESKLKPPLSSNDENTPFHVAVESSDWDDTWVVPDEDIEFSSPNHSNTLCPGHLEQIESLKDELSRSSSEINDLKLLLGLTPPESLVNNNNRRDSLQSIPEPTEFEYLKNIIYEYMMGKEPITLAKVIAAVLRFSDAQTQQVMRREEAKHPAK